MTPWQIGVILTANYTSLNYLVLAMGVLLLDDRFVLGTLPEKWKARLTGGMPTAALPSTAQLNDWSERLRHSWRVAKLSTSAILLAFMRPQPNWSGCLSKYLFLLLLWRHLSRSGLPIVMVYSRS